MVFIQKSFEVKFGSVLMSENFAFVVIHLQLYAYMAALNSQFHSKKYS